MTYHSSKNFYAWYQGQYLNKKYNAAEKYISSSIVRFNNCIQTISFNQEILLQECYHAEQDAEWQHGETFIIDGMLLRYRLYDVYNNELADDLIQKGDTVDVSQYPTAVYILLEMYYDSDIRFRSNSWNPPDGSSLVGLYHRLANNGLTIEYTYDSWLFDDKPIYEDNITDTPSFNSVPKQAWYMADKPVIALLPDIPPLPKPKPAELVDLDSEEYRRFLLEYEPKFFLNNN